MKNTSSYGEDDYFKLLSATSILSLLDGCFFLPVGSTSKIMYLLEEFYIFWASPVEPNSALLTSILYDLRKLFKVL